MKTVITISATGPGSPIHGVSIDEPLNPDFPYTQPEKSILQSSDSFYFDQSFDLTLGPHTLYYANTSDQAWAATATINENLAEMGGTTITSNVSNGNPLILNFNVIDHPVYPLFVYLFTPDEPYFSLDTEGVEYALNCLYPLNPFAMSIDPSKTGHVFKPFLESNFYTYKGYTANPDLYAGKTGLATRGYVWYGIRSLNAFQATPFELSPLGETRERVLYNNGIYVPAPFLICNAQPIPDLGECTIQCGHVREGADLRNLTWDDLIEDSQGMARPTATEAPCITGTQPALDYTSTITASLDWFRLLAPIIVPGRMALFKVTVTLSPGLMVGLPYIRIKESPAYWLGSEGNWFPGMLSQRSPTLGMIDSVVLTSEMIAKNYFTVEYGHVVPVSGVSTFVVAQTVKDGELQVPLEYTAAAIRNLQIKALNPPVDALIRGLTIRSTSPAVSAIIRRLDIRSTVSQTSAAIRRLNIKSTSPPPPQSYATLTGTVLNPLGQPVANCEISLNGMSTTTGDDGTFEIDNIPVGSYNLTVTPTNLLDKLLFKGTSMPLDLTLPTGYDQEVTLNLNMLNIGVGGAVLFTGIGVAAYETSKPKPYGYK